MTVYMDLNQAQSIRLLAERLRCPVSRLVVEGIELVLRKETDDEERRSNGAEDAKEGRGRG